MTVAGDILKAAGGDGAGRGVFRLTLVLFGALLTGAGSYIAYEAHDLHAKIDGLAQAQTEIAVSLGRITTWQEIIDRRFTGNLEHLGRHDAQIDVLGNRITRLEEWRQNMFSAPPTWPQVTPGRSR